MLLNYAGDNLSFILHLNVTRNFVFYTTYLRVSNVLQTCVLHSKIYLIMCCVELILEYILNLCGKTKVMRISRQPSPVTIMIDQKQLENVECFKYLGSLSKEDVPTWCKQFYYDFFLINGLYMFRTFTCPSSGVLIYRFSSSWYIFHTYIYDARSHLHQIWVAC